MFENLTAKKVVMIVIGIIIIIWIVDWLTSTSSVDTFKSIGNRSTDKFYYFYSPGCIYCQQFNPIWEQLLKNTNHKKRIEFIKIDGTKDHNKNMTNHYSVNAFPTMILVKNNGQNIKYTGVRTVADIQKFLHNNS